MINNPMTNNVETLTGRQTASRSPHPLAVLQPFGETALGEMMPSMLLYKQYNKTTYCPPLHRSTMSY